MSTITAGQVAIELRKLADSLDASPESIVRKPWVFFTCATRDEFVSTVKLLPRPCKKSEDKHGDEIWRKIHIEHDTEALDVRVSVLKSLTCELVEPAKPAVYRCVPILSLEEESEVTR
jgi:hypothetical protein